MGIGDCLKKVFSLKMRSSKVMASFTYGDSVNGPTKYLRRPSLLLTLKRLLKFYNIILEVGVNNCRIINITVGMISRGLKYIYIYYESSHDATERRRAPTKMYVLRSLARQTYFARAEKKGRENTFGVFGRFLCVAGMNLKRDIVVLMRLSYDRHDLMR